MRLRGVVGEGLYEQHASLMKWRDGRRLAVVVRLGLTHDCGAVGANHTRKFSIASNKPQLSTREIYTPSHSDY